MLNSSAQTNLYSLDVEETGAVFFCANEIEEKKVEIDNQFSKIEEEIENIEETKNEIIQEMKI